MGRDRVAPDRRRQVGDELTPELKLLAPVAVLLVVVPALVRAAGALAGVEGPINPWAYLIGVVAGHLHWSTAATVWCGVLLVVLVVLVVGSIVLWKIRPGQTPAAIQRVDRKAASMATAADVAGLLPKGAAKDAQRLRADHAGLGNPIGILVRTGAPLRSSYEWVQVWLMGPRAGKTSCVCVRQIIETTGPVVATSNKRDIVDLTRGPRSQMGHCWVFDPQGLIGEPPQFTWNPLTVISDYPDRMVEKADELAALFNSSATDKNAQSDAYFEPEAQAYLSNLLLAAAVADVPISRVWDWLIDPSDLTPLHALQLAGHHVPAQAVAAVSNLADEQRDGVIGTARKMVTWLRSDTILQWVEPRPGVPEFTCFDFLDTHQTMYLVSREGAGSARAVTAALAVAIMQAGEWKAGRSRGGRLATPLTVVLDEAANVVRWQALPDMYSHFGSRGIVVSTFLQSWAQGCAAWGEEGMRKLWSAANVRVVGAGIAEEKFLAEWNHLIGEHERVTSSRTDSGTGKVFGNTSTTRQLQRESIFDIAELAGMPGGRAVMLASGSRAALIGLTHWSTTDYADQVSASEEHFSALAIAGTHDRGI